MEASNDSVLFFDHPYPRYGLAATLAQQGKTNSWQAALDNPKLLIRMAGHAVEAALGTFRLHTQDDLDEDRILRYRYLTADELETSGQKAAGGYYIAPHVVINDRNARYLIKEARGFLHELNQKIDPHASTDLKRSFAPFTTKLNEGTASLSNPKSTKLETVFSLVATLTPAKPAGQVDFTNQVMIPDLDLEGMIRFVQLFRDMQDSELKRPLTLQRKEGSKRKRPPLFDGNYPDAPRSSAFGPVGLLGAMGQWAKRADRLSEVAPILDQMAGRPIYLVSYDGNLMRQEFIGHHAARLAQEHNLPRVIDSLYRARFYNEDDNKPDSPTRKSFFRMASRFLQLYTRAAFRDFLAFRVQYETVFSSIITDFIMSEYTIDPDIVRSARAYGAYLNTVAYFVARDEVEQNKEQEGGGTGRTLYEAKARALAQLEGTALSARRPSALFAQLNVMAGRQANQDVPAEAARFIEAVNTGEVAFDEAKDLVLAYMRLRSNKSSPDVTETSADEIDETGYMTDDS
ncbi:hypothetical protein [Salisaeta longa]|uniref:hypothetical protein n=1 Tax=Salisaeta longa TaxID=503170 RepID=UPI000422BC2C|nr:hypothetical protein [Salisaeta longa]